MTVPGDRLGGSAATMIEQVRFAAGVAAGLPGAV
jgi:hypothetical protein